MSFLNQLKTQAKALQKRQGEQQLNLEGNTARVKSDLLDELAKLIVSQPNRFT